MFATRNGCGEIEAQWGPAPGRQQSDGSSIFVLGERFGNVFVGIQPAFGYEGDPMRLLFEQGFAPTHAFSAFYRWLREDFGADAVLHFGTHGALEFMPGKQAGLSGACWPDRLIGDLPNLYLYASNNPSEGTIAKRRSGGHLDQLSDAAGRPCRSLQGLVELKASIDALARSAAEDSDERTSLAALIQARRTPLELAQAEPAWIDQASAIGKLSEAVLELEYTLIPHGLHVVGEAPSAEQRVEMLQAVADASHGARPDKSVLEAIVRGDAPEALAAKDDGSLPLYKELAGIDRILRHDHEIPSILRALDGKFVRPAPGGDLLRTPAILPTGPQSARLRSVPNPERLRRAGRCAAGAAAARHAPRRRPRRSRSPSRSCCGAPTISRTRARRSRRRWRCSVRSRVSTATAG